MTEEKNKGGRPTKMTPETLEKLELAFWNSFTDEEACLHAEIDPKTLYRYCNENPAFASKKEILKKKPNLKAKMNLLYLLNWKNPMHPKGLCSVCAKLSKEDLEAKNWVCKSREKLGYCNIEQVNLKEVTDITKFYLETKMKDEFSKKSEIDWNINVTSVTVKLPDEEEEESKEEEK